MKKSDIHTSTPASIDSILAEHFPGNSEFAAYVANPEANMSIVNDPLAIYIDITNQSHKGMAHIEAYVLNEDNTKRILSTMSFFNNTDTKYFSFAECNELQFTYHPTNAVFHVSGRTGNRPVYISTTCTLHLHQVTAHNHLNVKGTGIVCAENGQYAKNLNILTKVCVLLGDDIGAENIYVTANTIHAADHVKLLARRNVFLVAKSQARLNNRIAANVHLGIRAEGEISYDVTKLHAPQVEVQVSKCAQMHFPNNATTVNGFAHIGERINSKISYELIANDPKPIQILNESYFPHLVIKAANNEVIVGSNQKKATLSGKKILVVSKSFDIRHGGVFGVEVLCVKNAMDTKVGFIDISKQITFGQHLPFLPTYIGSNKLLIIASGNKLTMHHTELLVPDGDAWLKAEESDNFSSTVRVAKNVYWDIKQATTSVKYENLPTGKDTRKDLPPWNNGVHNYHKITDRALLVKTPSPSFMVYGTLFISLRSNFSITGGTLYAANIIEGTIPIKIASIRQSLEETEHGECGHRNPNHPNNKPFTKPTVKTHEVNYIGRLITNQNVNLQLFSEFTERTLQIKANATINSLLLSDMSFFNRLQLLQDAYALSSPDMQPYAKASIDPTFLAAAVSPQAETVTQGNTLNKMHIALLDQLQYLLTHHVMPVSRIATKTDEKLFAAIKNNNLAEAGAALAEGASINAIDKSTEFRYSPLQTAIVLGHLDIAKFLAQQTGIKFDYLTAGATGKTALDLAKEQAKKVSAFQEVVQLINCHHIHVAFLMAVYEGDVFNMHRAIAFGADVNIDKPDGLPQKFSAMMALPQDPVALARQSGARLLARDRAMLAMEYTPLMQNVLHEAKNHIHDVKENYRKKHISKYTLQYEFHRKAVEIALQACANGDLDKIEDLRTRGDDLLWERFCVSKPLLYALRNNQIHVATYLIQNGVPYLETLSDIGLKEDDIKYMEMDFSEEGILSKLTTSMLANIADNLKEDNKSAYNPRQLSIWLALHGQLLINYAKSVPLSELRKVSDTSLANYDAEQQKHFKQDLEQVIDTAFTQPTADKFLQILQKILLKHGDNIAAHAQFYADSLKEFKDAYEKYVKAQAEHERAMAQARRKAKRKRKKRFVKTALAVVVTSWVAPHLTVGLVQSGMAVPLAGIIGGGLTGTIGAAFTGGNIIKGATLGGINGGLGYLTGSMLDKSNMTGLLKPIIRASIMSVPNMAFNGGKPLQNIIIGSASELISTILPTSDLQTLRTETQMQAISRTLDDSIKIMLSATPALFAKGDTSERFFNMTMQIAQTAIGRAAYAHATREDVQKAAKLQESQRAKQSPIDAESELPFREYAKVSGELIKRLEEKTGSRFTEAQKTFISKQIKITRSNNSASGFNIHMKNGYLVLPNMQIVSNISSNLTIDSPFLKVSPAQAKEIYVKIHGEFKNQVERKPFRLPSVLPASSDSKPLAYAYALGRGIEQARDSVTDAVLHPIETAQNIGITIWDGINVIGEETVGITTQGAKLRNQYRGRAVNNAVQRFVEGDGVVKTEMASRLITEMVLSTAVAIPLQVASIGVAVKGAEAVGKGITFYKNSRSAPKLKTFDLDKKLTSQSLNKLAVPVDQELINAMRSKGWQIDIVKPGTEEYRYFTKYNIDASFNSGVPKHILIKEGAPKSALLEEFLHGTQVKLGLLEKYGSIQALEVHVKDFMLRHAKMLGLDNPNDIKLLQQLKLEEINRLNNPRSSL